MNVPSPLQSDLVLVGGGHSHALVLRKWAMSPPPRVRVTLINPDVTAPYTGMLPGHIAGHYAREALDIDLVRLARQAGARLIVGRAIGLDLAERRVRIAGRPDIRFDIASIDIGVTAELPDLPGFAAHAVPVKPLGAFAEAWQAFLNQLPQLGHAPACVIIGGGVAGMEVALAMAHRLRSEGVVGARITVLDRGPVLSSGISNGARRALMTSLERAAITILQGCVVRRVGADAIELDDGRRLTADFTLSAAGARPHDWLAQTGLALHEGFIEVTETLQSVTDPAVFATGDCAHLSHAPRPKAGVFAVRQAPVLFDNLRAALTGGALRAYRPQASYLKLISTGRRSAIADKFGLAVSGNWVWQVKDRIDRSFMDRLNAPPSMAGDSSSAASMPCGGCGSKVAQSSLKAGLAALPRPRRSDVESDPGDDSAVLRFSDQTQVVSVDHLRAFTEDPWMLARIAAVHALGDIWAMGAAPQAALASVIIPHMSEPMQAATLAEIMDAISSVVSEAGADLAGGHSSMGSEMTIGLTVTGLCPRPPIGLGGARPGDSLILTKPIGTGVILAAEMRGLARGRDLQGALASMSRPLARASEILAPHALAMTDVTGFGLAGHLMNLLDASRCAAEISLQEVPVLPGAEALATAGVRSSLWPSNAQLRARMEIDDSPRAELLFDPQTAGGLLAAVPGPVAENLLATLRDAGETASLIGRVEAGAPAIRVVS